MGARCDLCTEMSVTGAQRLRKLPGFNVCPSDKQQLPMIPDAFSADLSSDRSVDTVKMSPLGHLGGPGPGTQGSGDQHLLSELGISASIRFQDTVKPPDIIALPCKYANFTECAILRGPI